MLGQARGATLGVGDAVKASVDVSGSAAGHRVGVVVAVGVLVVTLATWAVVLAVAIPRTTSEVRLEYTFSDPGGGVYETVDAIYSPWWFAGGLVTVLAAAVASVVSKATVDLSLGSLLAVFLAGVGCLVVALCVWWVAGFWGDPVSVGETLFFAGFVVAGCWLSGWALGPTLARWWQNTS